MAFPPNDVTQGFRTDCVRLIGQFEQLDNVRFEGFCEIWTNMKFSLVFAGRKSVIEILEFCEDSLRVAKEFFLPPFSFKERIGGLYLLYGLYFKMPMNGPKIRIVMSDWQYIIEFRAEIGQAEHHDASFILSKLMSEHAFSHCLFQQELGLEKGYRLRPSQTANPYSVLPYIRELAGEGDLFERIKVLSEQYEASKSSESRGSDVAGASTNLSSGLRWYDSRFGEKLLESAKQLENSRKNSSKSNAPRMIIRSRERTAAGTFTNKGDEPATKSRPAVDAIRAQMGRGFDTDSSDSDIDMCIDPLECDKTLPDRFDYSSLSE